MGQDVLIGMQVAGARDTRSRFRVNAVGDHRRCS